MVTPSNGSPTVNHYPRFKEMCAATALKEVRENRYEAWFHIAVSLTHLALEIHAASIEQITL